MSSLFAGLDLSLTQQANHVAVSHDGLEDVASAYATVSEPLFIALCVGLIVAGLLLRRRALAVAGALAVLSAGLALLVAHWVSVAVARPRPFVEHADQITLFTKHAADAGFPSDHATAAFAIAGTLMLRLGWQWWPVLAAAVLLSVVRVVLGLHYPTDVLGGAVLGLAAAFVICWLARMPALTRRAPVLLS
jgi:undecaprenyl-diphosphatase